MHPDKVMQFLHMTRPIGRSAQPPAWCQYSSKFTYSQMDIRHVIQHVIGKNPIHAARFQWNRLGICFQESEPFIIHQGSPGIPHHPGGKISQQNVDVPWKQRPVFQPKSTRTTSNIQNCFPPSHWNRIEQKSKPVPILLSKTDMQGCPCIQPVCPAILLILQVSLVIDLAQGHILHHLFYLDRENNQ